MILKSELNAKNNIRAIGALTVPVLKYNLGVVNWRSEEITRQAMYLSRDIEAHSRNHCCLEKAMSYRFLCARAHACVQWRWRVLARV
jgi:hypothetical protein